MILELIAWISFLIIVIYNTLHWCSYIFTRFSKRLEPERQAIKYLTKMVAQRNEISKGKTYKNDDNTGYS